ncbi:MAG: hypothetical protein RLZZ297_1387 [Chloroflexota bacterium]|jgi:hypothetical protein
MHLSDPVIAAFADDVRFLQQKALPAGFSASQWKHYWGWNAIALAQITAAVQRCDPHYPAWAFAPYEPMAAFVDATNAVIDAQHPDWDASAAQTHWQQQCAEMIRLASTIPATQRADQSAFPWLNGSSIDDVLRMQTGHSSEHFDKNPAERAYDDVLLRFRVMYQRWVTAHAVDPTLYTHLWAWQQITRARLSAGRDGHAPLYPTWPTSDPDTHAVIDDINAWIQQTHGQCSAAEGFRRWQAGYREILALCTELAAADYSDPDRSPWLDGYVLLDVVRGSLEHHREHIEEGERLQVKG